MPPRELDIVVLSDFRFPGGTGTAIAEEVKAASQSGYSVGLVHLEAANLGLPSPVNPRIRALIDAGRCTLLPPETPCVRALPSYIILMSSPRCRSAPSAFGVAARPCYRPDALCDLDHCRIRRGLIC